jgi:hypothetical protein
MGQDKQTDVSGPPIMTDFEYQERADGIHAFVFHTSDRDAIDAFIDRYRKVIRQHDSDTPLRVLIDFRPGGIPSISYGYTRLRNLFSEFAELPMIYAAYMYHDSPLFSIAQTFLDMTRVRAARRFFEGQYDDEAIDWLNSIG